MSEMIERVAAALRAAGGLHNPEDAETLARAAIEAMREPDVATINKAHAEPTARGLGYYNSIIDAALAARACLS